MAKVLPHSSELINGVSKISAVVNDNPYPRSPLSLAGVLDEFKQFDVTPVVGREFPEVQLVDWIAADDSDALLRDLAITSTSISFKESGEIE